MAKFLKASLTLCLHTDKPVGLLVVRLSSKGSSEDSEILEIVHGKLWRGRCDVVGCLAQAQMFFQKVETARECYKLSSPKSAL